MSSGFFINKIIPMNHWLIKSEGECYSIDDLKRDKKTAWEGVRNYQARNFMVGGAGSSGATDGKKGAKSTVTMSIGDLILFYHSNGTATHPTGVYGIARVVSGVHPDMTQFDPNDEHYDPKSKKEKPMWHCVDVAFVEKFARPVTLEDIKLDTKFEGMLVRERGSRLSIQPVSEKHFERVRGMGK